MLILWFLSPILSETSSPQTSWPVPKADSSCKPIIIDVLFAVNSYAFQCVFSKSSTFEINVAKEEFKLKLNRKALDPANRILGQQLKVKLNVKKWIIHTYDDYKHNEGPCEGEDRKDGKELRWFQKYIGAEKIDEDQYGMLVLFAKCKKGTCQPRNDGKKTHVFPLRRMEKDFYTQENILLKAFGVTAGFPYDNFKGHSVMSSYPDERNLFKDDSSMCGLIESSPHFTDKNSKHDGCGGNICKLGETCSGGQCACGSIVGGCKFNETCADGKCAVKCGDKFCPIDDNTYVCSHGDGKTRKEGYTTEYNDTDFSDPIGCTPKPKTKGSCQCDEHGWETGAHCYKQGCTIDPQEVEKCKKNDDVKEKWGTYRREWVAWNMCKIDMIPYDELSYFPTTSTGNTDLSITGAPDSTLIVKKRTQDQPSEGRSIVESRVEDIKSLTPAEREALQGHQFFRCRNAAPPVYWNKELAKSAQAYADKLYFKGGDLIHDPTNTRFVENLSSNPISVTSSLLNWWREYKFCNDEEPCPKRAWHFTAMIWTDVTDIGCGFIGDIHVCRYWNEQGPTPNSQRAGAMQDQTQVNCSNSLAKCEVGFNFKLRDYIDACPLQGGGNGNESGQKTSPPASKPSTSIISSTVGSSNRNESGQNTSPPAASKPSTSGSSSSGGSSNSCVPTTVEECRLVARIRKEYYEGSQGVNRYYNDFQGSEMPFEPGCYTYKSGPYKNHVYFGNYGSKEEKTKEITASSKVRVTRKDCRPGKESGQNTSSSTSKPSTSSSSSTGGSSNNSIRVIVPKTTTTKSTSKTTSEVTTNAPSEVTTNTKSVETMTNNPKISAGGSTCTEKSCGSFITCLLTGAGQDACEDLDDGLNCKWEESDASWFSFWRSGGGTCTDK